MSDITLMLITSNNVPEEWAKYHWDILVKAAKDNPIMTISRKPMLGINLLQTDLPSPSNFYRQILRGAKAATTPYVALCEDDTLYDESHFSEFRPPLDNFAYNINRWSLYTWTEPSTYSFRKSWCGCAGIYPRELVIEAMEERFRKYPDEIPIKFFGELGRYEKPLRVTIRKTVEFYSSLPIIQFNHHYFTLHPNTPENVVHIERKRLGWIRAFDIPYWGKAEELVKKFR